jgi:predicted ATPase/DNA-binding SARP family transcriptional activator
VGFVRFGVLGPVAVWTEDGHPVRIPDSKVRALLADLLVHEGRLVSADRLVDDIWGDALPVNPGKTLQTRVWQLRRAMEEAEPGGRDLLVFRPPGYLLQISPDAVDMGQFELLTTRARSANDAAERAQLLTEALALWRGPAFADFADAGFARHAVLRLEEQRLAALEEQAEAQLVLGVESAGELGELVAKYPLRERLRAVHMRALYSAGRQSEALSSYGELRELLAEEHGLDPGPDLVALHHAILNQTLSPAKPPTNLPAPVSSLIGRADAVNEVCTLLDASRLVTLTGSGGVGKTRLAAAVARQVMDGFPDGVWLAELASATPADLIDIVATALGIRDAHTVGRLVNAVRARRFMLVLDNCEHLTEPVAELTRRFLAAVPGVTIIATSQEPLAVDGELLWQVPPLDEASAVELFSARAPGLVLDADNAEAVATICRRLDGIPLALELAATRVRVLGVRELASRLDNRFQVLAGGKRGAPARQQTLRAMIDWSWQLLTEAERIVLRRLSVHADGCTLDAAEQLCAGNGVHTKEILDLLARLVDRSLVAMTETAGGPRYRLLESVAAYCHERLDEAAEFELMRQRHRRYYRELAERAEPCLRGARQKEWLRRLDAETANLRAALDDSAQNGDAETGLRLVNAMGWYWFLRGRLGEARRSLDLVLGFGTNTPARATAAAWRAAVGLLIRDSGQPDPGDISALADLGLRARIEWLLGFAQTGFGAIDENWADRSLSAFQAVGDRWGIAATLSLCAGHALGRADFTAARQLSQDSAALFGEVGDSWGQLKAGQVLAMLAEVGGDYDHAGRLHRDGLRTAEELGLWTEAAYELAGLGRIALLIGDYATAEELHARAMRLAGEQSHQRGVQYAEVGLGLAARRQGRLDVAEKHLRNWLDWCRRWNGEPGVALILAELGFIAEQRGDGLTALEMHLEGLASARSIGDPRALALAMEGLAGAYTLLGRHREAAQLLGCAHAVRQSVNAPLPPAERLDVNRITANARRVLGAEAFVTEFEHGAITDPDDIMTPGPDVL